MSETTKRKPGRPRKPVEVAVPTDVVRAPKPMKGGHFSVQLPQLPEGDNNKYTSVALAITQMDACDLYDPPQVRQRIIDYFQLCADHDMKPAVNGLALCLGTNRQRLWEIASENERQLMIPAESKAYMKQAYASLQMLWENYMQNGKINPVSGIFLAKNHFGYKDQTEYVLTPNNPLGEEADSTTIAKKYDELPD